MCRIFFIFFFVNGISIFSFSVKWSITFYLIYNKMYSYSDFRLHCSQNQKKIDIFNSIDSKIVIEHAQTCWNWSKKVFFISFHFLFLVFSFLLCSSIANFIYVCNNRIFKLITLIVITIYSTFRFHVREHDHFFFSFRGLDEMKIKNDETQGEKKNKKKRNRNNRWAK